MPFFDTVSDVYRSCCRGNRVVYRGLRIVYREFCIVYGTIKKYISLESIKRAIIYVFWIVKKYKALDLINMAIFLWVVYRSIKEGNLLELIKIATPYVIKYIVPICNYLKENVAW